MYVVLSEGETKMAKKRKTLVDNFQQIIDSGDIEAFKAVFDKCEITACGRGASKCNALSFKGLTPVHIQFLIDNGININADCGFGQPAVAFQAYSMDNLRCLVENGADINLFAWEFGHNALGSAVLRHDVQAVHNLLACGASADIRNGLHERTFLEETLATCGNADIISTLSIANALLEAGAVVTPRVKEYVQKIGERFEFYRADFNKDFVEDYSNALSELYRLFDVPPVPQRVVYDGKSLITVKSKTWQEQHDELWNMLVPGSGHASTVQGELIRIAGKVTREILDNGAINWDSDYKKLPLAMVDYFKMADGLDSKLTDEACCLAKSVSANSDKKMLYRLTELTVEWVLANPKPIELTEVDYNR